MYLSEGSSFRIDSKLYRWDELVVRIAHLSDSHLGCTMFQLIERREDVRKCFERAIDLAMRQDPDILAHTGDLFDSPDPVQEDMAHAAEILKSITDRVRIFVVEGNHDIPHIGRRAVGPIRTLEAAGVIYSTEGSTYRRHRLKIGTEKVDVHLFSWARMDEIVRRMYEIQPSEDITLLFSHDIPSDVEMIPSHFDYVGCGHNHSFYLDTQNNIGRPGSTCYVNWKREVYGEKKLIIVDVTQRGISYLCEPLKDVRAVRHYSGLDITGMGPEEAERHICRVFDKLSQTPLNRPIVIIEVEGTIDAETEKSINRTELINYGTRKLNALLVHIEPRWTCLGARPVKLTNPLDMRTSIEEYIVNTGGEDLEEIIQIYDQIMRGDE